MAEPNPQNTPIYQHDPTAKLFYGLDWQVNGYLDNGVTVVTSTWTAPDGITLTTETNTGTITAVKVEDATANEDYFITNHIIMSNTEEDERSILIQCREL